MAEHYAVDTRLDVPVPMRDGINLSTDLYLPRASGSFPVILIRTPYNNNSEVGVQRARLLANSGFACAIQDCRGRWDSEGKFGALVGEGEDGFDTCDWLAKQDWCDGQVGTMGGSYLGWVQWTNAALNNPHLKCIAPSVMGTDFYAMWRPGGAMLLNTALTWCMMTDGRTAQGIEHNNWTEVFRTLPVLDSPAHFGHDIPHFRDWVQHASRDDYWSQLDVREGRDQLNIPALVTTGWYDLFMPQTLADFTALQSPGASEVARQSRLVVGPWIHALSNSTRTGEIDFGFHSLQDLNTLHIQWFKRWLKGQDENQEAPVKLFIMGVNEWHEEQEWPIGRTQWQKWYLHSGGQANSVLGDGGLSPEPPESEEPDQFVYDPLYPVQTLGGANCCNPNIVPWGPYDQRDAEMRGDVLCYTSAPLEEDLEVTGPIRAVLHAATDGPDTDWTIKLVDVWPTGYAMLLCDGIFRARFREGFSEPRLIEPNRAYEYEIDVGATGNVFLKGHRIRIEVSSSNFPRYDRNLNTGRDPGEDFEPRTARQTIYHDDSRPSHVLLPVIPAQT